MLDLCGIVFSSGIMFLVILRAIQLDRTQPWFRPWKGRTSRSGLKLGRDDPAGEPPSPRRESRKGA
jgi:hypothetical protein